MGWRLYVLVASPDGVGGFLCFETTTDPHDPQSECSFAMESSFGDPPPLGFPSRTEDPLFAYGSLGQHVARVEVELEGGKTVPAEIVGEHRAHYVAVLPQGTSPVEVVAYDPSGREVGRRPFLQDQPEGSWIEELEQHCGYTPDGGYFCEGGARGGGTSRGSRSYP